MVTPIMVYYLLILERILASPSFREAINTPQSQCCYSSISSFDCPAVFRPPHSTSVADLLKLINLWVTQISQKEKGEEPRSTTLSRSAYREQPHRERSRTIHGCRTHTIRTEQKATTSSINKSGRRIAVRRKDQALLRERAGVGNNPQEDHTLFSCLLLYYDPWMTWFGLITQVWDLFFY